jgi:hypothetical protein
MSTQWTHRNIIVPAAVVEQARTLCAALAGSGGEDMFTAPLSATGELPATHYISSGLIWNEFAEMLPLDVLETSERVTGNTEAVVETYPEVSLTDINNLLKLVVVTEGDPFVTLEKLQLQLVRPTDG